MRFKNALIYSEDFRFRCGGFDVENGSFANVLCETASENYTDLHGAYVLPGFIDMHCHGAAGFDFSESGTEGIKAMSEYLLSRGVTGFAATAMTQSSDKLKTALKAAQEYAKAEHERSSRLLAVRLEGPFLSPVRNGAQNPEYLREPSITLFDELYQASGGLLHVMDIAPELPGALELIRHASKYCVVSLGHTDAGYEQALAAIEAGASHITHICNGMKPMHHRAPGLIPAAAEHEGLTAELICDGRHVHPSMMRLIYRIFGSERLCLISDALSCCGAKGKSCASGGQPVHVRDGLAYLEDETLAGSARDLFEIFRISVESGIPAEDAVRMVTYNPARILGVDSSLGSIFNGKRADFLVCGEDFSLRQVYLAGKAYKACKAI